MQVSPEHRSIRIGNSLCRSQFNQHKPDYVSLMLNNLAESMIDMFLE